MKLKHSCPECKHCRKQDVAMACDLADVAEAAQAVVQITAWFLIQVTRRADNGYEVVFERGDGHQPAVTVVLHSHQQVTGMDHLRESIRAGWETELKRLPTYSALGMPK